ncbi:hypothetical protein QMK19_28835 [Streptomyces sp. H10-C2]|uniref:MvdC/MvdD family ATP grasp protein n=1 Tax=Streptomyces TaxID=1883 RepID=UPI0018DF518B|nr:MULTISPECIES: hypothetical protein [Streptomyces]MDJ0344216.1 hypothetical protein [Streptomyces sp. PH10-H1]MDJ0373554.1 hypothetical protein [Streptomyces sp. H10-C2]
MRTVLVVDGPHEAATDLIVQALTDRAVPAFRMDTAQFPAEVELSAHHRGGPAAGPWEGRLTTACRSVDLADIGAVYWNRPQQFEFPGLSVADEHWARGAARIGLGGVLTGLPVPWMNHPSRAAAAEFKPEQLRVAAAAGLDTLPTLVTNSAEEVRRFAKEVGAPLITKPLGIPYIAHTGQVETMYTRRVDLDELDGIETSAHLFQEEVQDKAYEVRVIVIGGACHGVRIDAGSTAAGLDWRTDYDALTYSSVAVPCSVAAAIRTYMKWMGLTYAAHDFVVRTDGRWTFYEANPSGQFAWLNEKVEFPLADTIADTLKGWCT